MFCYPLECVVLGSLLVWFVEEGVARRAECSIDASWREDGFRIRSSVQQSSSTFPASAKAAAGLTSSDWVHGLSAKVVLDDTRRREVSVAGVFSRVSGDAKEVLACENTTMPAMLNSLRELSQGHGCCNACLMGHAWGV